VGKAAGKPGAAIVNDTFAVSGDDSRTLSNASVDLLQNYQTGRLSGTGDTTTWPVHGEVSLCRVDATCTVPAVPGQNNQEIVAHAKVPGSTTEIDVIARGRFGTAPVDWTGKTANLTLTIVRDSTKDHPDKSATTIYSDLSTNTTTVANQFEVHHGAATFDNLHTSGGGIGFVSTNTAGVTVTAANLADVSLIFEDSHAQTFTTVSPDSQFANYAPPGLANLPISILHPGGSPAIANNIASLGISTVGNFNFSSGNTDNWPQNGVLIADNEDMAFVLDASSDTKVVVTARGLCGTTPALHSNGIQVQFLVTELPCGAPPGSAPGLKGYASNGFTIGSPTGGDKGSGALNAQAIYRNGAALGAANWTGGSTVIQSAGATGFYPCQGYVASATLPEAQVSSLASLAGTLRNLRVQLSAAPGSGKTVTVTIRINGLNSALTCTVSGTNTTCADTTPLHSASVMPGQTCSIQAASSLGSAAVMVRGSTEFDN
jgi:hypothetical protein